MYVEDVVVASMMGCEGEAVLVKRDPRLMKRSGKGRFVSLELWGSGVAANEPETGLGTGVSGARVDGLLEGREAITSREEERLRGKAMAWDSLT